MKEYIIGIDVGGTNIKSLIMDTELNIIGNDTIPTNPNLGFEVVSNNIIDMLENIFISNQIKNPKVASVAMGLPGIVDVKEQKTIYLAYIKWDGFNPCEKIARHFGAPCIIDNDANINVLGEYTFGIKKRVDNVVLVTLGTGFGCGIVLQGQVFRGSGNLATEFGHMTIVADGGYTCLCGQKGHLEAYCSGTAMELYAKDMMTKKNTLLNKYLTENNGVYKNEMIDWGVQNNDEVSIHIMNRFIRYLTIGCSNIMKLFNPELILLGGGISNAGSIIIDPLNKEIVNYIMHPKQYCPIEKATLGSKAGMYGACALAAKTIGLLD